MENILAFLIIAGGIGLFGFMVWKLNQRIKRDRIKREEQCVAADKYWAEQRAERW